MSCPTCGTDGKGIITSLIITIIEILKKHGDSPDIIKVLNLIGEDIDNLTEKNVRNMIDHMV